MQPKIRLFPLNGECVAISATFTQETKKENLTLSTSTFSGDYNFTSHSRPLRSPTIPLILDNGYFFSEESWLSEGSTVRRYSINNILSADHASDIINTKQELDISMIATLRLATTEHLVIGVSRNRDELYLYTLTPSTSYKYNSSGQSQRIDAFDLDRFKTQGTILFTTPHTKIRAIAGFPQLPHPTLALLTDNGEILLSKLTVDLKLHTVRLQASDSKPSDLLNIFSTARGLLIAHDPNNNILKVWDISKNNLFLGEYACPTMHHLSISVDGTFLTGIDGTKESNLVHCFELPHFSRKWIRLDTPIEDFVIGKNRQVCFAYYKDPALENDTDNSLFSILVSLTKMFDNGCERKYPGTIDALLLAQEQKPAIKKEAGFLSKMSSLFKSPEKSNTKTLILNEDEDLAFLDANEISP